MSSQFTIIPASDSQRRIWFEWQLYPHHVAYNNPLLYHVKGELDSSLLEQTLQHIVQEQPSLRSYFLMQGGQLRQVLESECVMKLDYHDISHLVDSTEQSSVLENLIHRNVRQPFCLSQLPLFRFSLIQVAEAEYWFVLNIHHIVVDGYSASKLIHSISSYYQACILGLPLVTRDLDFSYQHYFLPFEAMAHISAEEEQFWQTHMQDAQLRIDLLQKEVSPNASEAGVRTYFSIDKQLTHALKRLAKQLRTTEFNLLLAAYASVLSRFANQDDLTIGYPVDVRPSECKDLFGFFVNNLPFRIRLSAEETITSLVQQMNEQRKRIKPYQKTDLSHIIRSVRALFSSNPDRLYHVSLVRANFALSGLELSGTTVTPQLISTGAVKDELCLLYDEDETFQFALEYQQSVFDEQMILQFKEAMIHCFMSICKETATTPLSDVSLFDIHRAMPQLLPLSREDDLIQHLISHATGAANQIAIQTSSASVTYQALITRVRALCSVWHTQLDTSKPVIVCLSRTPDLVATLLALQWLGVAYVPVELKIAYERLRWIIEDCEASALIVDECTSSMEGLHIPLLGLNEVPDEACNDFIPTPATSDKQRLAYIIYTSGSTGTPKGVAIHRLALNNFLKSMAQHFMREESARLLAITTIGFDIAGLELYLPLWQKKSLYLANDAEHKDPLALSACLSSCSITHLQATPAMWQMLLEVGWQKNTSLTALCGGDALTPMLASQLLLKVNTLWNLYGPTEATIWCSLKAIRSGDEVTVGKPIDNMQMQVLDRRFQPLPPYIKGELFISGIGLAQGYVKRDQLNQSQFIPHQAALGARLYRAGDTAYINECGEFVIVGRTDHQVKLHGFRIELGEIEARLLMVTGVLAAAVVVVDDQLVAYLQRDESYVHELTDDHLMMELLHFLPDYMTPKRYFFLPHLPLNASGKVDRKYLAALPLLMTEPQVVPPQSEDEVRLCTIWQTILGQTCCSVTAHFYSVGGYSLLSVQLTMAINREFHLNLSLSDVLNAPTIRQQARLIEISQANARKRITPDNKWLKQEIGLLPSQHRIWFATQIHPIAEQYHMAAKLTFNGHLDEHRLKQALNALLMRHDALRLAFFWEEDKLIQRIVNLDAIELTTVNAHTFEDWTSWASAPFHLDKAPLWRMAIHRVNDQSTEIGWVLHHLITDGYSVSFLLHDLFRLYEENRLETIDKGTNGYMVYVDLCLNQVADDKHRLFWRNELLGCPYLKLPYDNPGARTGHGQSIISRLDKTLYQAVSKRCRAEGILESTYLIGVFALLFNHYSKQVDFCIGLPVVNREHALAENLVGCFMEMMPLRVIITKQPFWTWLKRLEELVLSCHAHARISLNEIIADTRGEATSLQAPLFPVVLNIQPSPFEAISVADGMLQVEPIWTETSKYDLSLEVYVDHEGWVIRWEFADDLFQQETIRELNKTFYHLLNHYVEETSCIQFESNDIRQSLNDQNTTQQAYVAPETPNQKKIASAWEAVLQQRGIGLDDHFFKRGGHSLLAARLVTWLYKEMDLNVSLDLVFKYPVLRDYCAAIEQHDEEKQVDIRLIDNRLPLTPNQRQIALGLQNQPNGSLYQIGVLLKQKGHLDSLRLQAAWKAVLQQHSIYRWQLLTSEMTALLVPEMHFKMEEQCVDEASIHQMADVLQQQVIDPQQAPLLRVTLLQGDHAYVLVSVHHLIADEWSLHTLIQDVFNRYDDPQIMPSTSHWEKQMNRWLNPSMQQRDYWRETLGYVDPASTKKTATWHATEIRASNRILSSQQTIAHSIRLIPADIMQQVIKNTNQAESTLYHLVLTLFIQVLFLLTGEEKIDFAVTMDRRKHVVLQQLHGYLVNLVPWSVLKSDNPCLIDHLNAVKQQHIERMTSLDVDFAWLMEQGMVSNPSVIFNFQHTVSLNTPLNQVEWVAMKPKQSSFPMVMNVRLLETGLLELDMEYHTARYQPAYMQLIGNLFAQYFDGLAACSSFNAVTWPGLLRNQPKTLPQISERQNGSLIERLKQASFAEHHAVEYDGRCISYQQLWHDVDCVSMALINVEGVHSAIRAVHVEDKYWYVVAILAVLQVGGAFVGIDPHLPLARKKELMSDCGTSLVITDSSAEIWGALPALRIDKVIGSTIRQCDIAPAINLDDPAYLIYTSGSTGKPKATLIAHRALISFLVALKNTLQTTTSDRVLQFASCSFDASIWEIFLALISGATLIIPNERQRRAGDNLQQFMQQSQVTHAILTPSVLNTLNPDRLPCLKTLASGGEACQAHLIQRWAPHCAFYNAYGPSEATVCVTLHRFQIGDNPHWIGRALGEAKLQVISNELSALPAGSIGELCIGGPILALYYLHQPEQTARRFIEIDGERWYRTGDKVRLISPDEYEFLGRLDRQVKLRGIRIELAEIEQALQVVADIQVAYCTLMQDQLRAFILADKPMDTSWILQQLAQRLPPYMLPNQLIQIAQLPLLTSGKVDIKGLELLVEEQAASPGLSPTPQDSAQAMVHACWCEVLQLSAIDMDENFFALGGNSLQAMALLSRMEAGCSESLSMEFFYTHGSIRQQAKYIQSINNVGCINDHTHTETTA